MLNLFRIYENFLILFNKSSNKTNDKKDVDKEHIASLYLGIIENDKDTVDIKCLLPNVTEKTAVEISDIAEKYAQLLVLLNTDHFNKNIFSILNKHKESNQDNYKTIMLIDNIVSYWDIFYNLQTKNMYRKYKSFEPMIKPSEAFKLK